MKEYILSRAKSNLKKYTVQTPSGKRVSFGARGYQDYTMHKDPARKERYVARHSAREKWGANGIETAGFWSRWLLWNKPTIDASAKDIETRFGIRIIRR